MPHGRICVRIDGRQAIYVRWWRMSKLMRCVQQVSGRKNRDGQEKAWQACGAHATASGERFGRRREYKRLKKGKRLMMAGLGNESRG